MVARVSGITKRLTTIDGAHRMSSMRASVFLLLACTVSIPLLASGPRTAAATRPQKYASYKAHTILPSTLRYLVRKNGKHLFAGLERGLAAANTGVDEERILAETDRITIMVNRRRPFHEVVHQMGYVSGLVAQFTHPAHNRSTVTRSGFDYYMNLKLGRFLFVFDGYGALNGGREGMRAELLRLRQNTLNYGTVLEKKYREVGGNARYRFGERSAVFGICSIYFSNLARVSAHLWYDAWHSANGDVTQTPFQGDVTTAKGFTPQ